MKNMKDTLTRWPLQLGKILEGNKEVLEFHFTQPKYLKSLLRMSKYLGIGIEDEMPSTSLLGSKQE